MSGSLIDQLKDVESGKAYKMGGTQINLRNRIFRALWKGENIGNSPTVKKNSHSASGLTLKAIVSSDALQSDPFGVTLSITGGGSTPNRASVYWNSSLYLNEVLNNNLAITGLATEGGMPNDFQFDYGNDLIWVEATLDGNGTFLSAAINSWGLGGTWQVGDGPYEFGLNRGPFECQTQTDSAGNNFYPQFISRRAIFISQTSTTSPFPVINRQLVNTNLIVDGDVYIGKANFSSGVTPITVPFLKMIPYGGGYVTL